MHDAQSRLDDLLTATTSYREELAREIIQRVDLLQEQMAAMSEAAAILAGRPVEERAPPEKAVSYPEKEAELRKANERIGALNRELATLRGRLESGAEPLSQAIAQANTRAEDAERLAERRGEELTTALARVEELEVQVATLTDRLAQAAAGGAATAAGDKLGEVKMKEGGTKERSAPAFGVPKSNTELYERAVANLGNPYEVFLLDDGSLLYKPMPLEQRAADAVEAPPHLRVAPVVEGRGLARSPKPIVEMRSGEREKERRLESLVEFIQSHYSFTTFNSSDMAEDMSLELGVPDRRAKISSDFRDLEERGVIHRTGEMGFPRAVQATRDAGKMGGRPAILYRLDESLRQGPPEGDVTRKVRDYVVTTTDMTTPLRIAEAVELPVDLVLPAIQQLVERGILADKSPSSDMPLFQYSPAKGPGRAAEIDRQRRASNGSTEQSSGGDAAVAGTGKGIRAHKDVLALIQAAERAGARVKHAASGHFEVTVPGSGKRILISSTPSNPRSILNDRARLRKAGLAIA